MELFPGERILVTYGDGLGNIDINSLISFHEKHNKLATVTAVRPPPRFGYVDIVGDQVKHFGEKNQSDAGWINGGFFVLESEVFQFIHSLEEPFETGALSRLTNKEQLMGYRHEGFWQPMDTLRERNELSLMALERIPPWLRGLSG
jgi:glucose-1-phosphate cytidylyltransferase